MTMDIANFYLMTPLKRPEYVKIKLRDIPEEIIIEYKLRDLATPDGNIHQSNQRNVQTALRRPPFQRTTGKASEQTRISAKQTGARIV